MPPSMAPTTSNNPPLVVRRILQKPEVRQLIAEGRHRIVAKGIARFIADIARCARGRACMVCLWVHFDGLEWKSNFLVDLTTTKFLPDDEISRRITETETEDELLAVIDGLYEPDKPQRKRKSGTATATAATDSEVSANKSESNKKAKKGINKAVIRQLKRAPPVKEVDDVYISSNEGVEERPNAPMFPFNQPDELLQDQDVEMTPVDGLEEKHSAENDPSLSSEAGAVSNYIYKETAKASIPEEEGLFVKSDSEPIDMHGIPLRSRNIAADGIEPGRIVGEGSTGNQSTPIGHVIDLVENSTAESFDTIKDEVLKYFRAVQQASTAKAAQIQSQLGEGPENRIQALKTYVPNSFSHISEKLWTRYNRKLSKFCQEPGFLEMDYMQRLERVMDIFYLPEEEMAFGDCDWRRMELAVSICVAITEMMGDDAESEEEEGKAWAEGKLEDIRWLKKISNVLPMEKTIIEIDSD